MVLEVLLSAAAAGRRFHVIVLDSRPELEGRQMLKRLLQVRTALPALSAVMDQNKHLTHGRHACNPNGYYSVPLQRSLCAATLGCGVAVLCVAAAWCARLQVDSAIFCSRHMWGSVIGVVGC